MHPQVNIMDIECPSGLAEMADYLEKLWNLYFITPKIKKDPIQKRYNLAAARYNEQVGFRCMTLITSATKDNVKISPAVASGTKLMIQEDKEANFKPKKEGSVIGQIINLHKEGKTNKEIIALGYNKSTVGRQISEYKKSIK